MAHPPFIGPYPVVRELGRGGMGVVYEVRDPSAGRTLALKQLLNDEASEVEVARFRREVECLQRVSHRGVVRVFAQGRSERGPYLVQELVEGESLEKVAQRGLEPREAARIVRDVAEAVEAAHSAGVLHRDLKPANVVVRPDGIPVLLDFGLARDSAVEHERLTRTGATIGTPAYMSPEQAGGHELDTPTDVYSLGATLYTALVDAPPFEGGGVQVLKAVLTDDPVWPRARRGEVPRELDAIVRHAMAKDPAERYRSAAHFAEDLERFLAGTPPLALARQASWRFPLPLVAGGLVCVGLLAAFLGVFLAWVTSTPTPGGVPSPAPSLRASASPAPLKRAPLWSPGEFGAEAAYQAVLTRTRASSSGKQVFQIGLNLRAHLELAESGHTLALKIESVSCRAVDGKQPDLKDAHIRYHTGSGAKGHPLSPLSLALERDVRLAIDADGRVTACAGLDAVGSDIASALDVRKDSVLDGFRLVGETEKIEDVFELVFADADWKRALAHLTSVRDSGWSSREVGTYAQVKTLGTSLLPLFELGLKQTRRKIHRYVCDSSASYAQGGLSEARIVQEFQIAGDPDVTLTYRFDWKRVD